MHINVDNAIIYYHVSQGDDIATSGFLRGFYEDLQEICPAFQPSFGYCQNLLQPAWYQSTRSFDCVKMTKEEQDFRPATQIG